MRRACGPSSRGFSIRAVSAEFLDSLETLAQRIALLGALNSLSQITLKATMPGVPDFYQGTEFWDLSLVDPDNRRPVDFAARAAALAALETPDWAEPRAELARRPYQAGLDPASAEAAHRTGRCVRRTAITSRCEVSGPHRDHVIAFARRHGRDAAIVAVAKSFAAFSQGGRAWPRAEAFDGALDLERLFGGGHRRARRASCASPSCSGICRSRC